MGFVVRNFWILPMLAAVIDCTVFKITNSFKGFIDSTLAKHHRCLWAYQKYVCLVLPVFLYGFVMKGVWVVLEEIKYPDLNTLFWVYEWSLISIISVFVAFVLLSFMKFVKGLEFVQLYKRDKYLVVTLFVFALIAWFALMVLFIRSF